MLDFADAILSNKLLYLDITDGATHYHADYVNPSWAKTKTKTVEIQDHIFYRWEK
jgi:spore germination cell wall hydrolase CwlJ-like protein|tara:strand:+ start:398 stop:562 length:165 start_codon:yes stop_codon:yes gene_type:complete